jgi:non-homologous end joining protein Ku
MLKIHFPFDVSSVARVSGHAILNGSLALNKTTVENAVRADDFVKIANRIVANFDAHPPPSRTAAESFDVRLTEAVTDKLHPQRKQRAPVKSAAQPRADDESFGEQLKKAVETHSGSTLPTQKQRREQSERERARYRHKPRPHKRSD